MWPSFNEINDATGFANGDRFDDAEQVRAYFTAEAQRDMVGHDALTEPDVLEAYADAVVEHGWHMKTDADRIRTELHRLGANTGASGIVVHEDDTLPAGWVYLSDGHSTCYGPAAWVLDDLRAANPDDESDDEGNPSGWHSAWAALYDYPDHRRSWDECIDDDGPDVRTDTVVSLARNVLETRDLTQLPILADALQDAGCGAEFTLADLRSSQGGRMGSLFLVAWLAEGRDDG